MAFQFKDVDVLCMASRASIRLRKFKLRTDKLLDEINDQFAVVFELEDFMTKFHYFYNGKEIKRLHEIKEEAPSKPVEI